MKMPWRCSLGLVLASATLSAGASDLALRFSTNTPWTQPRFYLFGRWEQSTRGLLWADGRRSKVKLPACAQTLSTAPSWRLESGLEISVSADWWALRMDPSRSQETLILIWSENCKVTVPLQVSWDMVVKDAAVLVPRIVLNAEPQKVGSLDVSFAQPASRGDLRASLDTSFGFWSLDLPNAPGTSRSSMVVLAVQARLQTPYGGGLGLSAGLDQGFASLGKNVVLSNWNAALFYRVLIPFADGLHLRPALGLRDQSGSSEGALLSGALSDSMGLMAKLSAELFWARRWMLGLRGELSFLDLSPDGAAKSQSYYGVSLGYRLSPALSLLAESGYRAFAERGFESESAFEYLQLGARLEF
jgi:hypothetical protein